MRIIYLPNKIYKLYDYAKKHNVWHAYREKYGKLINDYTYLRTQYKVTHKDLQEQLGISRATYYRRRRILNLLDSGAHIELCSKPHSASLRKWSDAEIALVRQIREGDPTYEKSKIYHILRRDHGFTMSESTVGRILKHLMDRHVIGKSISAQRKKTRRKYELQKMLKKYNEYRPHYALNGLTPMMYINKYHEAHQLSQFV